MRVNESAAAMVCKGLLLTLRSLLGSFPQYSGKKIDSKRNKHALIREAGEVSTAMQTWNLNPSPSLVSSIIRLIWGPYGGSGRDQWIVSAVVALQSSFQQGNDIDCITIGVPGSCIYNSAPCNGGIKKRNHISPSCHVSAATVVLHKVKGKMCPCQMESIKFSCDLLSVFVSFHLDHICFSPLKAMPKSMTVISVDFNNYMLFLQSDILEGIIVFTGHWDQQGSIINGDSWG